MFVCVREREKERGQRDNTRWCGETIHSIQAGAEGLDYELNDVLRELRVQGQLEILPCGKLLV